MVGPFFTLEVDVDDVYISKTLSQAKFIQVLRLDHEITQVSIVL